MLIPRTLFAICFTFSVYFLVTQLSTINITTDLKDLSPNIAQDIEQQAIIDKFSGSIQHRFILLIQSKNASHLDKATESIIDALHSIDGLSVSGEDKTASPQLLQAILPYRHQLLTPKQKQSLENVSAEQISLQANERLYQLDSAVRLLPFNEDPLGYTSDYILYLLAKLLPNKRNVEHTMLWRSIAVTITDTNQGMQKQTLLFNQIHNIERKVKSNYAVDILHSGLFFFATEAAISTRADIEFISTGSTLLIILLLLFVFRSLWPLFLPVISILLGIIFAIAINYYLYSSLHILTIIFGASLIGIVIDYSLHFFYHHIHGNTNHKNLHRALLLSLLTSMVGYGALGLADLAALRKIALFSCCGLFMAWLSVLVLGQYMLSKKNITDNAFLPGLLRLINRLIPKNKHVILVLLCCTLATGAGTAYLAGFSVNDDPRLFYRVSADLLEQEKQVSRLLSQYEPGRFFIVQGKTQDSIRADIARLRNQIQQVSPDTSIYSITDILPDTAEQKAHYQLQSKLYQNKGAIETLYTQLGIDSAKLDRIKQAYLDSSDRLISPGILQDASTDLPPTWFDTENKLANIVLIKQGSNTEKLQEIASGFDNIDYIHSVALAKKVLKQQRIAASGLLALAFLLIAILLLLYYRSLLSLLALCVPLVATLAVLFYLSISQEVLTLFHIMALFLVLGLGMDYVIFSREMHSSKQSTQQAIVLSALTTLISFGFLGMSTIPIAQSFGLTVLIGNTINLLGALVYSNYLDQHNYS